MNADLMTVTVPDYDIRRHPCAARIRYVLDPEIGPVAVRWRLQTPQRVGSWIWWCTACGTKTVTADCGHAFAVAVTLAEELLGLRVAGVVPHPTIERTEPC